MSNASNQSSQLSAQQLLQQFNLFRVQFNEQQQTQAVMQQKLNTLEASNRLQHIEYLRKIERELEEYYFKIQTSQDDDIVQYNLALFDLTTLRINNVDYRGSALRDLFQLQRGALPERVANISVQKYINWLQKLLSTTANNPQSQAYYNTLLKHIHFQHPILTSIKLNELLLLPQYFSPKLGLWSEIPTPIEYHRLLISIAYDLPFQEVGILPLLTHFGLPIAFPDSLLSPSTTTPSTSMSETDHVDQTSTPTAADKTSDPTTPPQRKNLEIAVPETAQVDPKIVQKSINATQHAISTPTDPYFYIGISTHLSSLLYAPLWFGVLSRDAFRGDVMFKAPLDKDSFICLKWFSTLCRAGCVFDQMVRIACGFSTEGLYPAFHAYSTFLPRFFSSGDSPLTDPTTFVHFGHHGFSKIYAFLLFVANHLASTHSLAEKYQITASSSAHVSTPHPNAISPRSTASPSGADSEPQKPSFDTVTYPFIKELYLAGIKGNLDTNSLAVVLRSPEFFNSLSNSERNKANMSRCFALSHFKIGVTPTWLAKPLLATISLFKSGSIYEPLCTLHTCEHLQRYFDRGYDNCCEKAQLTQYKQLQEQKRLEMQAATPTSITNTPLKGSQTPRGQTPRNPATPRVEGK